MLIVGRRENYLYIYNISIDDTNLERSSRISIALLTCVLPSTFIRYNGARKFITLSQNGESPRQALPVVHPEGRNHHHLSMAMKQASKSGTSSHIIRLVEVVILKWTISHRESQELNKLCELSSVCHLHLILSAHAHPSHHSS